MLDPLAALFSTAQQRTRPHVHLHPLPPSPACLGETQIPQQKPPAQRQILAHGRKVPLPSSPCPPRQRPTASLYADEPLTPVDPQLLTPEQKALQKKKKNRKRKKKKEKHFTAMAFFFQSSTFQPCKYSAFALLRYINNSLCLYTLARAESSGGAAEVRGREQRRARAPNTLSIPRAARMNALSGEALMNGLI